MNCSSPAPKLNDLLLIGASAGGPAALASIIAKLPSGFRAAVVIAQHVDSVFIPTFVKWLSGQTTLHVRVAHENDGPKPGSILIADTRQQVVFRDRDHLGYRPYPPGTTYQPCIDAFFESAAAFRYDHLVGMVLTGMGKDGARGLKALRNAGALTIAQDAASSVVYGMPKAAVEGGAAKEVLSLQAIAPRLTAIFSREGRNK